MIEGYFDTFVRILISYDNGIGKCKSFDCSCVAVVVNQNKEVDIYFMDCGRRHNNLLWYYVRWFRDFES